MTTKTKIAFALSIALTASYAILSLVFSLPLFSSALSILKTVPLIVLLYNINSTKNGRKILILAITCLASIALSFGEGAISKEAPLGAVIIKSLSSVFPLLPLIVITDNKKNKVLDIVITVVIAALTYVAFDWTNNNYYYLYSTIEHYSLFLIYSNVLFLLTVLLPLSEVIFGSDKNYLSLSLLTASIIMSFPYYWAIGEKYWYINPLMLTFILILLIYISREGKKLEVGERRRVTFTRLHDVEIEHLKKKKKAVVYELPPNIPVDDRPKA